MEQLVYTGTYTRGESKGIYAYRFDAAKGSLTSLGLAAETANPSFLVVTNDGQFLYAVNESDARRDGKNDSVSAFKLDRSTGRLSLLNQVSSRGTLPCYVTFDRTGKYLLVANYGSGSLAVFPAFPDGRVGEASAFEQHHGSGVNPERQEGPHVHSVNPSPDNRFALAADLGLDQLWVYQFDEATGAITRKDPAFASVAPGAGPRHFVFSPNGNFLYLLCEMGSLIAAFAYDKPRGALSPIATASVLPDGFRGESTAAEIRVHPSGRFLYASNRGADTIAVFLIDGRTGALSLVEHAPTQGKTPRGFELDATGAYLFACNQDSATMVIFRVDQTIGRLTPTGTTVTIADPACVKFLAL